jgi:rhomboid protease GluP
MFNQPTNDQPPAPKPKRPHPLEEPLPPEPTTPPRQRGVLHIPVAKPRFTYILIGINVLIFIGMMIFPQQAESIYEFGANNHREVLQGGQYHRLLTAMFLHGSIAHVALNMYSLYIIGVTIERFFGNMRFLAVYFLGGLAGSILSVLLNGENVFSVGASGALFAVFGAEIIFLYKHRKLFGEMGKQQLRQLIVIAGINFAIGIISTLDLNAGGVVIDNWGHFGGFAGGLLLAWFISPLFLLEKHATNENEFVVVDVNPLMTHYTNLLLYGSGLMVVLIIGTFFARGGFR